MEKSNNIVAGKHLPELDGLRAIAILLVLWWHASDLSAQEINYELGSFFTYFSLTSIGAQGVTLFFCISGFLITGILIDTSTEKNCLKKFYIRRALRIFPLYYLFLFLALIFSFLWITNFELNQHFFYNFFYIQNWAQFFDSSASPFRGKNYFYFGHTWSLAIEEQFYIIWPAVFLFLYRKLRPSAVIMFFLIIILGTVALRFWLSSITRWDVLWTCTITRMDGLLIGAFLAYLYKEKSQYLNFNKNHLIFLLICLIAILIFSHIYALYYLDLSMFVATYGVLIFTVLSLVPFLLLGKKTLLTHALQHSYLRHIAKISYGLYLYHYPIFKMISANFKSQGISFLEGHFILLFVGSALTFVVAWLSYHYFEKPILNLKDKFAGYEGNS